jgi:hypothetical protein
MSSLVEPWKVLPNGPLTAIEDPLSMSLSLDDLPDLPGAREAAGGDGPAALPAELLEWSEDAELRDIHCACDDAIVIEYPIGEWQQPSEFLS